MIRHPHKARPDEGALSAMETVTRIRKALPVVQDGRLPGLFTFHDLLEFYLVSAEKHDP